MATPIVSLSVQNAPTIILRKGVDISLGRAKTAQIQFIDPSVSRKHATIRWKDTEFPIITDCDSSTGLMVDDQYVEYKYLHHVHRIVIGNNVITSAFHEDKTKLPPQLRTRGIKVFPPLKTKKAKQKVGPSRIRKIGYYDDLMPFTEKTKEQREQELEQCAALLTDIDDVDGVVLFGNFGKDDERGFVRTNRELHELLTFIEDKHQTGTLRLISEHKAEMVFAAGRIVRATCGKLTEMAAVQHIFTFPNARFTFSYSIEVGETRFSSESELGLTPTGYIKKISRHVTRSVAKPSRRLAKLFEDDEAPNPTNTTIDFSNRTW